MAGSPADGSARREGRDAEASGEALAPDLDVAKDAEIDIDGNLIVLVTDVAAEVAKADEVAIGSPKVDLEIGAIVGHKVLEAKETLFGAVVQHQGIAGDRVAVQRGEGSASDRDDLSGSGGFLGWLFCGCFLCRCLFSWGFFCRCLFDSGCFFDGWVAFDLYGVGSVLDDRLCRRLIVEVGGGLFLLGGGRGYDRVRGFLGLSFCGFFYGFGFCCLFRVGGVFNGGGTFGEDRTCLLYTSDAADE